MQSLDARLASLTTVCIFTNTELSEIDEFINVVFYFKKDKKNLIDELEILKNQYSERDNEVIRLQELLERVQADKTKLSRRVSKLVLNGKEIIYPRFDLFLFFYRKRSFTRITKMSSYNKSTNTHCIWCFNEKTFSSRST